MDLLSTQLGALSLERTTPKPTTPQRYNPIIVQLLAKNDSNACYFHYSKALPFITAIASVPDDFVPGRLYKLRYDAEGKAVFKDLYTLEVDYILKREKFGMDGDTYEERTLPDLLLGCRNRDFEQSAATVVQVPRGLDRSLIISAPVVNSRIDDATFRTLSGERFRVVVDKVNRGGDKKMMTLFCTPTSRLPSGLTKNSRLIHTLDRDQESTPIVTDVLEDFCMDRLPLPDFDLQQIRWYGRRGTFAHRPLANHAPVQVRKLNGTPIMMNPQQSEAVRRCRDVSDPALIIEASPGSGKTLTAAAIAVLKGRGVYLFLSTGNVAVFNMANALADLDHSGLKIVHLLSVEAGKKHRSPFGYQLLSASDRARIARLELELEHARGFEKRELIDQIRQVRAEALARTGGCDVIFATVDKILSWLRKETKKPCPIQKQLQRDVTCIVIDEASQMTEAALNAIHLSFPTAKIVLIGDSKQMPPFRYTKDEVTSELCARSALDVMKRKKNVPVVMLKLVYRASQRQIEHYNREFYGGTLVSGKPASNRNPLACIMKDSSGCLFVRVKESKAEREAGGTSLQNDAEIRALVWLINKLRQASFTIAGYDEDDIMVICFYDAQRRLAKDSIPDGFEVLTVDSAQGREKSIVIVLTTVDSPTASDFFKCPLRLNVAMSRHKDAIMVLGHSAVLDIEPWSKVLDKKYFDRADFGNRNAL